MKVFSVITCLVASLTVAASALAAAPGTAALDALQWQRRVLVVFSPGGEDSRWTRFRAALDSHACEVSDRDLTVIELFGDGTPGRMDQDELASGEAAALRERFVTTGQAFAVVLVGKDGGEKLRMARVPALDEVFALIDGMPMRRAERRARGSRCGR